MAYEMVVGLKVTDADQYAEYRRLITPLLKQRGGGFRYDFVVANALASETAKNINRVFVIYFGSREQQEDLFSNDEYLAIKERFFKPSVENQIIISEYET